MTIADLIGAQILGREISKRPSRMDEVTALPARSKGDIAAAYERKVFAFLHMHRGELGIQRIWRCRNHLIDGALELQDGAFVPIEIKYRMNWLKACQAEWQFRCFLRSGDGLKRSPRAGIVFFEAFSGDWARAKRNGLERGWLHRYADHLLPVGDERFQLRLVRFARRRLSSVPSQNL